MRSSVCVAARVRPCNADTHVVKVVPAMQRIVLQSNQFECAEYELDHIFDETATQSRVFSVCVEPVVRDFLSGVNGCVFAYGATGAGKSHTMHGSAADLGMVPRAVMQILQSISHGHSLAMSAMELYNGHLHDMLNPQRKTSLKIMESVGGVQVCELTEHAIHSYDDFSVYYEQALKARSLSATQLNAESSRGHFIITMKLTERDVLTTRQRLTTLNLVDLAGNEDNRKTGNVGQTMVESSSINLSLFALVKVIDAIRAHHSRIPFRESKLTRILQNSLGGNCRTVMLCCINPRADMLLETQYTLNYASKARGIEAVVRPGVFDAVSGRASSESSGSNDEAIAPSYRRLDSTGQHTAPRASYMTGTYSSRARAPREGSILLAKPVSLKRPRTDPSVVQDEQQAVGHHIDNVGALDALQQARRLEISGALADALQAYSQARQILGNNEKLNRKIAKLTEQLQQHEERSKTVISEDDEMIKRLQAAALSEADMIEYMLSRSTTKRRRPNSHELDYRDTGATEMQGEAIALPIMGNDENVAPNHTPVPQAETEKLSAVAATPSKADLKKSLNSRIMQALNVQLLDIFNDGSYDELLMLHGIGPKRAQSIVAAREAQRFACLEDLSRAGIKGKVAAKLRQAYLATLQAT